MWSAIKSDLFEFVNTIQQDTTTTLNKVLGEEEDDNNQQNEQETVLEKLRVSVRRTYETYSNPLKEHKAKEFEKFKKRFHLTSYSKEIAIALDEEPEVSRFYAELVPLQIPPEEFWARLFFRLHLLNRNGTASFEDDDDDEEELVWEEDIPVLPTTTTAASGNVDPTISTTHHEETRLLNARIKELEEENLKLKGQVKSLVSRVAQLELEIKTKEQTVLNAKVSPTLVPSSSHQAPVPTPTINMTQTSVSKVLQSPTDAPSANVKPGPSSPSLMKAETASNSSEGSGLLVPSNLPSVPSMGSTNSLQEKDEDKEESGNEVVPNVRPATEKYFAALDDDEDEDGWN